MKQWWFLVLVLLANFAHATIELGKDYELLPKPLPPSEPTKITKIEVLEFFQYSCVHCAELAPVTARWASQLPPYVKFKRVHIVWKKSMEGLARLYATETLTGTTAKLHPLIFNAVLHKQLNLANEAVLIPWLKTIPGLDAQNFIDVYPSFSATAEVARAVQMTKDYAVTATPMLVVGGKYVLKPAPHERLLSVLNELIQQVRKERGLMKTQKERASTKP